ncbi:tetratricopeptide repeat protein [Microbulbifer salipaludis]|uniref:Tetratricopeptide repeat protein n=1 Tax=Microbulbifer salipaludis TaxID=187980 RepID=A0ABS3E7P7_9GAMM|nr:tetratricopeptide repeat-containing sulfotransferase family protein [Microbulbifer salipaludis]MBN8431322.1 tetratricopeptide repeat protein [Microbulbifer salipaludis]
MQFQDLLQSGLSLYRQGQLAEAEQKFRAVLAQDASNVAALNLLGMLCVNSERAEEAVTLISSALEVRPQDHQALSNLGLAYRKIGQLEQAEKSLRSALNLNAENPPAWNNLGSVFKDTGRFQEAVKCFDEALKRNPNFALCWSNLAHAFVELDELGNAKRAVERALQLDPSLAEAHYNRGEICRRTSHYAEAVRAYETALQHNPDFYEALLGLATAQREAEDTQAALDTLRQLLRRKPDHAQAHCSLGIIYEQTGDKPRAVECFKEAIRLAPDVITPHYQLAQIKGRTSTPEELAHMEKLCARPGIENDEADAAYLYFGLGEAYDKNGESEKAFAAWSKANAFRAKRFPYDEQKRAADKDALLTNATQFKTRAEAFAVPIAAPRMLFVIGMPRSGTSLTDQVLASHSAIGSLGEVSFAYDMTNRVQALTGTAYPAGMSGLTEQQLAQLAGEYRQRIPQKLAGSAIVLDKTPMNYQCLGLLAEVFPDARFIHCQRNPIDNCFSIFKLPFAHNQEYSHSLAALAHHYGLYEDMMDCWKTLYPGRILDVRYEDTVADLEAQARGMAAFIGVDFEEAMLAFYEARRQVRTPSASQVRQPIYRSAVGAWRPYEQHLQPLIEALAEK